MSVTVSPFLIDLQKRSIIVTRRNFKEGDFQRVIEWSGLNGGPLHMKLHVKNIPPLHNEIMPYVLHHLNVDQTLTILEIEGFSISINHIQAIAHSLKTNTSLQELILNGVVISYNEIGMIMTSLGSNNCLKHLGLRNNNLDFEENVVEIVRRFVAYNFKVLTPPSASGTYVNC